MQKNENYPMEFNRLNRSIREDELEVGKGLSIRIELGICTWKYLNSDPDSDFSPATYRAMRKVLRPHMFWILEHCGEEKFYINRAEFFLALTADSPAPALEHLDKITDDPDLAFSNACTSLRQMILEHQKNCKD